MARRPDASAWGARLAVGAAVWMLSVPGTAAAQVSAQYFRQNCAACHTIGGGRLTGPDLKDVTARRDRAWLVRFVVNPKTVIDSGDPYARQLVDEARGVIMPALPGMTPDLAGALIDLIDAESAMEKSAFAGLQISDRPFTAVDVTRGEQLFTGRTAQAAGGPPCLSCHSVGGVGLLGGGKLGPDLTLVYERLQGRKGLGAWLSAPATPTMQTVFRDAPLAPEEVEPLLAFFEDSAKRRAEADPVAPLTFFLIGLGGAVFGLVAFDLAWQRRFRGVRQPMVFHATSKGTR